MSTWWLQGSASTTTCREPMSTADRQRWNERYQEADTLPTPAAPVGVADVVDLLPTTGRALDVACGVGAGSVWLAMQGLAVVGIDGSDVAIDHATRLAATHGVEDRCRFEVRDLDAGLPPGPSVDLVMCHLFSARALDEAMVGRLHAGGVLAITVLSEVGSGPGPFRAGPGELMDRFGLFDRLEIVHHRELGGSATLVGVVTGPGPLGRLD